MVPVVEQGGARRSLKEIDAQVQANLDRFFADERCWQQVKREVSRTSKLRSRSSPLLAPVPGRKMNFRVQVPKPYPGVQYRKSKDINDKYPRYAEHGFILEGEVEEDLEWVRVRGGSLYLPLRIGPVQILEPLPDLGDEASHVVDDAVASEMTAVEETNGERGPKTVEMTATSQRFCCGSTDGSPDESNGAPQQGNARREAAVKFFAR